MSRATRIARGFSGALLATIFAAASHALGGGRVTTLAVVATIVLALPLCVALAGRLASLWRLAVAVGVSQFLFHWCFWALGSPSTATADPLVSPHAAHLGVFSIAVNPAIAGAADAMMWIAHGGAAILTIALIHRGERAAVALFRRLRRALPTALPRTVTPPPRAQAPQHHGAAPLRLRLLSLSTISHRGPPAFHAALVPCR